MALNKYGSPSKITVVKESSFSIDPNFLAESFLKQWPEKQVTVDQIHTALKSIGVNNYSSEDMDVLLSRLSAIGFKIEK